MTFKQNFFPIFVAQNFFAMDYKYKVFISYRREDAVFKDTVYNILSEYIDEDRIFVDKKDLYNEPNAWAQSLDEALHTSEYIVICINKFTFVREPKTGKIDWYYKEIETALVRQKAEGKIRIIPAINVRPEFDKTQFNELSKLQDVAYLSLGKEDFRKNLLKMVGIDAKTASQKPSSAPSVINNTFNNTGDGKQINLPNNNGNITISI